MSKRINKPVYHNAGYMQDFIKRQITNVRFVLVLISILTIGQLECLRSEKSYAYYK
jgi:hypothetical protein